MTIVKQLNEASDAIRARQDIAGGTAKREFAIALTAIEDAVMRVNRGFAIDEGVFAPADVEANVNG